MLSRLNKTPHSNRIMKPIALLSQERLKEVLSYNPETGVFTWIKKLSRKTKLGSVAGSLDGSYLAIRIDKKKYKVNRLAWLYMTGEDPGSSIVEHKDQNKTNNAWTNLRLANQSQNIANIKTFKHNTTGYKGVSKSKTNPKYQAKIQYKKKSIYIGSYDTPGEASAAYQAKALELFGEFAARE